MALINCPECGKEISDKAEKCISCGYILKSDNLETNDYYLEYNQNDMQFEKTDIKVSSNNKKKMGILVAAIVLVVLGCVGFVVYNKLTTPTNIIINSDIGDMKWEDEVALSCELTPKTAKTEIEWKSSDDSIISVDQNGNIKALKDGTATITATTANNISGSKEIKVCTIIGEWKASKTVNLSDNIVISADNNEVVASTEFSCDGEKGTISYNGKSVFFEGPVQGPVVNDNFEYQTYTLSDYNNACNIAILNKDEISITYGDLVIFLDRK